MEAVVPAGQGRLPTSLRMASDTGEESIATRSFILPRYSAINLTTMPIRLSENMNLNSHSL